MVFSLESYQIIDDLERPDRAADGISLDSLFQWLRHQVAGGEGLDVEVRGDADLLRAAEAFVEAQEDLVGIFCFLYRIDMDAGAFNGKQAAAGERRLAGDRGERQIQRRGGIFYVSPPEIANSFFISRREFLEAIKDMTEEWRI